MRRPMTTCAVTQGSQQDPRQDPRTPASKTHSKPVSKPHRSTIPDSIGEKQIKMENSVEYRLLVFGKAIRKGSQILVSKPQYAAREHLSTIRKCFKTIKDNPSGHRLSLMDKWTQWKKEDVPAGNVFSKTCSYINKLKNDVDSTGNVGMYIAGVKDFYDSDEADEADCPAPTILDNRTWRRLEHAFNRIMRLTESLTAYYDDIAFGTFSFLEGKLARGA